MKIFAVTRGEYSDYHIVALTVDYDVAMAIKKKFDNEEYGRKCFIEEYEDGRFMIKPLWYIIFDRSGSVIKCEQDEYYDEYDYLGHGKCYKGLYGQISTRIAADNQDSAIKIAAEKRAKFLAEEYGL